MNWRSLDEVYKLYPLPFKLAPLQEQDVRDLGAMQRIAFFYAVGAGKTVCSTLVALMWNQPHNLVIVPPILIDDWANWLTSIKVQGVEIYRGPQRKTETLQSPWVVMSHAIFRDDYQKITFALRGADASVLVDECFVAGTCISTPLGNKPIESIEVGEQVFTSDGVREVSATLQGLTHSLYTLRLSNGTRITATGNHPIFTDRGWTPARDCAGRWVISGASLRDVQYGVQEAQELASVLNVEGNADGIRLFESLRRESSICTEPRDFCGNREKTERGAKASPESPKKTFERGTQESRKPEAKGPRASSGGPGWKRGRNDSSRNTDSRGTWGTRVFLECSNIVGFTASWLSNLLQGGLWKSRIEDSRGSGWGQSSNPRKTETGSKEDRETGRVRVESVSCVELKHPVKTFNLTVAGCPHYFAGGILVHNCQALKNSGSKLFRYVNGFSANRNICLMTATPTTKPVDSYSYIKLKTPQVYRSLSHFENLHVAERDIFKSVTKWRDLEAVASALALQAVRRDKREMFGHNLDPINMPIKYKLSSSHYRLYQQLMDEQLLLFTDGTKIDATTAQRLYHASQQIILNYDYFSGKEGNRSATYDLLDQVIEEVNPMDHGSSKLVVWTYYQRSSAAVTQYLKAAYGDSVVAAYGAVDSGKAVKAIMHDDRVRILVAQPSSVGVGLNLHHVCSEMLFLEMATSPMQIRQAMGRVDRVGQTVRPTIRFALAERTVQNKLFNRLLDNDELVKQVEKTPKSLREEIFGL